MSGFRGREILRTDVHAIRVQRQGKIHPVVDDEMRAVPPNHSMQLFSEGHEVPGGSSLVPKLDHRHSAVEGGGHDLKQRSVANQVGVGYQVEIKPQSALIQVFEFSSASPKAAQNGSTRG